MRNFAVAIFGPTGVGKTSLALDLAVDIGEIISVDSMQVYKYMDIGTAKPHPDELKIIPHHLIDIITPDIQFTAGKFKTYAEESIQTIIKKNKIPFLVGGTGLYFTSLMRGMLEIPKVDPKIKEKIIVKSSAVGQGRMYQILEKIDPEYAAKIHKNDSQRTLRALEIFFGTKKRFSSYLQEDNSKSEIEYLKIGINIDRKKLYEIINKRVDQMINKGLADEVNKLLSMGYNKNDPGMKAIGYKELIDHFENKISFDEAVNKIKLNSRHYAKRQLTWFNSIKDAVWFDVDDRDKIKDFVVREIKYRK